MGVGHKLSSLLPPIHHAPVMRFDVVIDDHYSLGSWSRCRGLSVEFGNRKEPDGSSQSREVPGENPKYGDVTLVRALTSQGAREVQDWLAAHWKNPKPGSAQITLRDTWGVEVMSWALRDIVPRSWTGPELDAGSKQVALETLVLGHEGFLADPSRAGGLTGTAGRLGTTTGAGTTPGSSAGRRAQLGDGHGKSLEFVFNPNELKMSRRARYLTVPNAVGSQPAGHSPNEYRGSEPATLTVLIRLNDWAAENATGKAQTRRSVADSVETLRKWTVPTGADKAPPVLTFAWGSFPKFHGHLRELSLNLTKFKDDGTPSACEATVTLQEESPAPKGTNPTSGGIEGRRLCLLVEGETLHSVAHREYGSAALWRQLAAANGVDDPLRLRPGTRLLLPPDL